MSDTNRVIKIPAEPRNPMCPLITNEMQKTCIGRFFWVEDDDYINADGDAVERESERVVPWSLVKDIYRRMAMVAAGINVPTLPGH